MPPAPSPSAAAKPAARRDAGARSPGRARTGTLARAGAGAEARAGSLAGAGAGAGAGTGAGPGARAHEDAHERDRERRAGDVAPRLAENARWLWGVCYRMTGSSADADDLVQETFARAMERPPTRTEEPIGPWLLRVAVNLGRDALRRRRRRRYTGTWLPAAVDGEEIAPLEIEGDGGTEGRYDLLESVSFAFLLALEVLTPNQRAVLVLRDVLDRSVRETAGMLGLSETNVKVLHHRARAALAPYEQRRALTRPTPETAARAGEALQRFLAALSTGDEAAVMATLAGEVEAWSDGGGQFLASKVVVRGAGRVARMYLGLAKKTPPVERFALRPLNGVVAFVAERTVHHPTDAPRFTIACDVDGEGKITRIYSVLAGPKLAHVRPLSS